MSSGARERIDFCFELRLTFDATLLARAYIVVVVVVVLAIAARSFGARFGSVRRISYAKRNFAHDETSLFCFVCCFGYRWPKNNSIIRSDSGRRNGRARACHVVRRLPTDDCSIFS